MASVNHQPCGVRIVNRNFRRSLPHAIIAPTKEICQDVACTNDGADWALGSNLNRYAFLW